MHATLEGAQARVQAVYDAREAACKAAGPMPPAPAFPGRHARIAWRVEFRAWSFAVAREMEKTIAWHPEHGEIHLRLALPDGEGFEVQGFEP